MRVGANVQAGQNGLRRARRSSTRRSRARSRAPPTRPARVTSTSTIRDPHIRKAMIELGPDEALTYTPDVADERVEAMAGNAMIATTGDPEPELLADLDGERVGRAQMTELAEIVRAQMRRALGQLDRRRVSRTRAGRRQVFGEPDVERLWEAVAFCTRLDEADPVAAWREHMAPARAPRARAERARARRDPLPGPGHGLHGRPARPDARWMSALFHTASRASSTSPTCRPRRSSRPPTARRAEGDDPLEPSARAGRRRRRGPPADVRGRQDRRRAGGAAAPTSSGASSRPTSAPRTSASWRSSTARPGSGRRASPSSTRSSTRTQPATSPTASAVPEVLRRASRARE